MKLEDKVQLWWERFNCRKDLYGIQTARFDPDSKKLKKYVSPAYVERYRSKKSREGLVVEAPSEIYIPLSKEVVESHVSGRMEILVYMPRLEDDTTNFAAIDFDLQHGFHEVQRVSRVLDVHNVPHGIARSTSKGHHIYIFFDQPIKAYMITNFMNRMFIDLGYYDKMANDERGENDRIWTNPEIFPKVISISGPGATGYGIKPALNLKALEQDRCCFVDINDKVIGGKGTSDAQWEHLKSIPVYSVEVFNNLISELGINVDKDMRLSEKRGAVKQNSYKSLEDYKEPEDGDFMAVINGCNALRRIWASPPKDWPHHSRVAMVSLAMKCKGGLAIIRQKIGDTAITNKQIEHSMKSNQQPWCCKTIQEHGICLVGRDPSKTTGNTKGKGGDILTDYCFEKSPPREIIEGKIVINPKNLPEAEWSWPSPVRLRLPFKRTGIAGIRQEITELTKDDPELDRKLEEISRKIAILKDAKSRDSVFDYLKSKNLTLVKTLKHFLKEAKIQKAEEEQKGNASLDGYREINGKRFTTIEGWGYTNVRQDPQGDELFIPISNFEIEFDTDVTEHPIIGPSIRIFSGHIKCRSKILPFQIGADEYPNNNKLSSAIYNAVGPDADFKAVELDLIRSAINLFGCDKTKVISSHEDYGFNSKKTPTVYRSTTGNITAQGFSEDDDETTIVDMSKAQFARKLGLKDLDKVTMAETVNAVLNNFLSLQDSYVTYTTLAHALQAAIHNVYIPFKEAPSLYIDGTSGVGKSELANFAQMFHGDFPEAFSIDTTLRSADHYAMIFKDALFVLDDFKKGLNLEKRLVSIIQKGYDRSERGRLNADMRQGDVMSNRSLMMFTGEAIPTSEASVIARLVYVPVDTKIKLNPKTTANYEMVKKHSENFSGITAKFIQFMLQNYPKKEVVFDKFSDINSVFREGLGINVQNGPRITNNLSANYLTFELFMEYLLLENFISREQHDAYLEKHRGHILHLRTIMIGKCSQEQASNVFIGILREMVISGACKIEGLSSVDSRADVVGYVDKDNYGTIYLFPSAAYRVVIKTLRESNTELHHTREAIGKQLHEDGMLTEIGTKTVTIQKRFNGSRPWVWALDGVKAGIGYTVRDASKDEPRPKEGNVAPQMPLDQM